MVLEETTGPDETSNISGKAQNVQPIIISDQKSWMSSRNLIQQKEVRIKHCIYEGDCIQEHSSETEDHLATTRITDEGSHKYYKFKPSEEKRWGLFFGIFLK